MPERIPRRLGSRRRIALLAPLAALIALAGLTVVNAGATNSGPQVIPPNEPANQLTVNVAADGTLTLPFRSTGVCGGSVCPSGMPYTTIAPGKTNVLINDSGSIRAKVSFGKVLSRNVGPRHLHARAQPTLSLGELTVSVTVKRTKVDRLVLIVEANPYETVQHVVVTLNGGDGGDTGTISVSPNPTQAGPTDIVLVDNRDNKVGTPQLFLGAHFNLVTFPLGTPGVHVQQLMCSLDWNVFVKFPNGDGPTTTTIAGGGTLGPHATWYVEGSDPSCTTSIT